MARGIEVHNAVVILKHLEQMLFPERAEPLEDELPVFTAPFDCKVLKLGITPHEALVGADVNYAVLTFKDKGADGTGTDEMAKLALVAGVDIDAFDFKDFGTVSEADLAEGDVVSLEKSNVGDGMYTPKLLVSVIYIERP